MMHLKNLITTAPVPGSDNWHTAVMAVDPDTAQQLLEGNHGNRRIAPGTVARYAAAMRNGDWAVSPEPLIFAPSGRLLNGQHRLSAVVASGVAQRFFCVFGVDDRVFSVLDRGKIRSLADAHAVDKKLAEVARLLAAVTYPQTASGSIVLDNDFLRVVRLVKDAHDTLQQVCSTTAPFFSTAPVRAAAVARILSGEDAEWVLGFYRALVLVATADLPPVGGAALAAVTHGRWITAKSGGTEQRIMLARAWNLFQKSGAERTRVPAVDPNKVLEELRTAMRQAAKDASL